jgi:nucleoside phosphorylase
MWSDRNSTRTGWGPSSQAFRSPTLGSPQRSPPLNKLEQPPSCDDFGVAIICALPIEAAAVTALFDEQWHHGALDKAESDTNQYSVGSIAGCGVVLAHMPAVGKVAAATVAGNLLTSFHYLKLVLLVGTCGGAPKPPGNAADELFLGDVVVGTGVVQYDFGRRFPNRFVRKDMPQNDLSRLSVEAGSVLAMLQTDQAKEEFCQSVFRHLAALQKRLGSKAVHPGRSKDRLFRPDYLHKHRQPAECSDCSSSAVAACDRAMEKTCEELGCGQQPSDFVSRRPGDILQPAVHFGLFGSGDTVMRSGRHRDETAAQNGGVMAFEMEAAGMWEIMQSTSCLVVKGICNYSDSHKNKTFQGYAAAVAAATAKSLLQSWNSCKSPETVVPLLFLSFTLLCYFLFFPFLPFFSAPR